MFQVRICPNCSLDQVVDKTVAESKFRAESLDFESLTEYWRGFRSDSVFFTYVRCAACGTVYAKEYFSDQQLETLYGFMPDNTNSESVSVLSKTQMGYARQIKSNGFQGGRVLEVGADIGLLVEAFKKLGMVSHIDAVEPNLNVRSSLEQSLDVAGKAYDSIDDLPTSERYDLVAGIHVLDHLTDLQMFLKKVVTMLNPDGQVYFVTHNEKSLLRILLGRKWPPFCPQHPHLFNPETIRAALEKYGFEDVRVRRTTNYFSIRHIVRVASQLFGLSERLVNRVPELGIPITLGNISVQARLRRN